MRDGTNAQVQIERIHRAGEQDVAPVEAHRSHVHADQAIGQQLGQQIAGAGADDLMIAARFLRQEKGDATRGVTACAGL